MGLDSLGFKQRFYHIEPSIAGEATTSVKNTIYRFNNKKFYRIESYTAADVSWKGVVLKDKDQNKTYTINDKCYQVTAKQEKYLPLSSIRRIVGITAGVFLTLLTLGMLPIFSKSVRELFTGRQVLLIMKVKAALSTPSTTPKDELQNVVETTTSTL